MVHGVSLPEEPLWGLPHSTRHSYPVVVLKATKNLEAVRRLLGHRDYTTIKVYLDLTQEDLEQELSKLFSQL
jgi:site-specific recombinase XerD